MLPKDPDFRQHILQKEKISNYLDFLTSKNLSKLSDLSGFYGTSLERLVLNGLQEFTQPRVNLLLIARVGSGWIRPSRNPCLTKTGTTNSDI